MKRLCGSRLNSTRSWYRFGLTLIALTFSGWLAEAVYGTPLTEPAKLSDISTRGPADRIATSAFPSITSDPTLFLPEAPTQVSHLVLRLSERQLYAYQGDRLLATYPVAVGRDDWETPVGEFTVFQLQQHPAWEHPFTGEIVPPGPENPLGARWIGFWSDGVNSIGFHGTPNEDLIGQAVSHGCVRMRDADIVELYEWVALGAGVIVMP